MFTSSNFMVSLYFPGKSQQRLSILHFPFLNIILALLFKSLNSLVEKFWSEARFLKRWNRRYGDFPHLYSKRILFIIDKRVSHRILWSSLSIVLKLSLNKNSYKSILTLMSSLLSILKAARSVFLFHLSHLFKVLF